MAGGARAVPGARAQSRAWRVVPGRMGLRGAEGGGRGLVTRQDVGLEGGGERH